MKKYTIVSYWVRSGDMEHYDYCCFPISRVDLDSSDVDCLVASGWLESEEVAEDRYDELLEAYWGDYNEAICRVERINTVTEAELHSMRKVMLI